MNKIILTGIIAFLLCIIYPIHGLANMKNVSTLFLQAKQGGEFQPPSPRDLKTAESLFYDLLCGNHSPDTKKQSDLLGFVLTQIDDQESSWLVLMEKQGQKRGRGFYIFATPPKSQIVLMMPHSFHDEHTWKIGMELFFEGPFQSAAWNTVHRYSGPGETLSSGKNWDMADLDQTYWAAYTRAFARAFKKGRLIQLHGFSSSKRKTLPGRQTDLILSNTTLDSAQGFIREIRECLVSSMPVVTRIYPDEITELGGTQNSNGQIMRTMGHTGFIHIEMNSLLRKRLREDPLLRKQLIRCITVGDE